MSGMSKICGLANSGINNPEPLAKVLVVGCLLALFGQMDYSGVADRSVLCILPPKMTSCSEILAVASCQAAV
jgi:hypothetical protein